MKIVQLANTLSVSDGGPARNSFELNVTLNQMPDVTSQLIWIHGGYSDSVISSYAGAAGPLPCPGPQKAFSVTAIARTTWSFTKSLQSLRDADVVICHGYFLSWLLPLACFLKIAKVPFVIAPHGSLTNHQRQASRLKKAIFEIAAGHLIRKLSSGFVTGSRIEADELRTAFKRVKVEAAGVGTSMPNIRAQNVNWGEPLRILSLSRIAPKKRIDLSMRALSVLHDRNFSARLDIVGTGNQDIVTELKKLSVELQVQESVTFHGQVDGVGKHKFFEDSDIYILPSDDENFGISLAEAMANGLPAVISRNVASGEAISGNAGRVVGSCTPESLADAIQDLVSGDRTSARREARQLAEAQFSWRKAGIMWVEAIGRLCRVETDASGSR